MSTLKLLKDKLQGKITLPPNEPPSNPNLEVNSPKQSLEIEEARYLLTLIAKSDFSGKDIQIVYNVALKLQSTIKLYIKEEEDGNLKMGTKQNL